MKEHRNNNRPERREQDQQKFRSDILTFRLGQFFGFLYNTALLAFIYDLIKEGNQDLAIKLFTINATLIGFVFLVTTIERKFFRKKRFEKRGGNFRGPRRDDRRSTSNQGSDRYNR